MSAFFFDERAKIVVSGHFGNFELAGYLTGLFGLPSTTIAENPRQPFRQRIHHQISLTWRSTLAVKGQIAHEIQRLLEARGTLGLLADQDAGTRGCWVDFPGEACFVTQGSRGVHSG